MTGTAGPHPSGGAAAPAAVDSRGGGEDVRRFWSAYAVSAMGSGVGAGALPLVAILVVHASDWQVSLLAVLGGLAGVAMAVPLGPWIEFHHKRPTMIAADLLRFAVLASVPVALLAPAMIRRAGLGRTLLYGGVARCLWMGSILLAPPTTAGFVLIIAADSALLLCAGIFNPAFATYRMTATPDTHLSRVVGAWAMTSKVVQPMCIAAAGLLAATAGIRTAIAVLAVVLLVSAALLPWAALRHPEEPSAPNTRRNA